MSVKDPPPTATFSWKVTVRVSVPVRPLAPEGCESCVITGGTGGRVGLGVVVVVVVMLNAEKKLHKKVLLN